MNSKTANAILLTLVVVGSTTAPIVSQIHPPTTPHPTPPTALAKAIVGSWRGELIIADRSRGFIRTALTMRFNEHGVVFVRRDPLPARDRVDTWTADYLVLGDSIMLSVRDGSTVAEMMLGVTVDGDIFECVTEGTGRDDHFWRDSAGISMRRE